ncbi:MAG: homoserine dehydrogenase [Actinomycetota bacterium]
MSVERPEQRRDEADLTRVAVCGLGGVGSALLELIVDRRLPIRLVAAADSKNSVFGDLDPEAVLAGKREGQLPGDPGDPVVDARPDVLVDAMSCDFETGEPSLSVMLAALESGASVVTANKVPLARCWNKLHAAARASRATIGYAGAAGAALPAVAVARALARADRVSGFRGVLSGTTTFVLEQMMAGRPFAEAVTSARDLRIAEPDPSIDLGGWDTACKAVILANIIWSLDMELPEVSVDGIDESTDVSSAGRTVRLTARARLVSGRCAIEVGPEELGPEDPLAALKGRDKGMVFQGPSIGTVALTGGRSHPRGAAAAVLSDLLEAIRA